MKKSIKLTPKQSFIFLLVFTIIMLAVTVFASAMALNYRMNGIRTDAEIIRIDWVDTGDDESARVTVRYEVDGTTYTEILGSYSSSMDVGETVGIYYLPDDPADIMYVPSTVLIPSVTGLFTVIMIVLTVVFKRLGSPKRIPRKLMDDGDRVSLTVTDFSYKPNFRIMGKHPATVTCTDAIGNEYRAKFLYDYTITVNVGDTLYAYVDRDDPSKYAIDMTEYLEEHRISEGYDILPKD